jgi:hypothetical protein
MRPPGTPRLIATFDYVFDYMTGQLIGCDIAGRGQETLEVGHIGVIDRQPSPGGHQDAYCRNHRVCVHISVLDGEYAYSHPLNVRVTRGSPCTSQPMFCGLVHETRVIVRHFTEYSD